MAHVHGQVCFGPWSRFCAKPVYHDGQTVAWELFDGEVDAERVQARGTYFLDVTKRAGEILREEGHTDWVEKTAAGLHILPT